MIQKEDEIKPKSFPILMISTQIAGGEKKGYQFLDKLRQYPYLTQTKERLVIRFYQHTRNKLMSSK